MPRKAGKRKKTRTHIISNEENAQSSLKSAEDSKIPRTVVVRKGKIESEISELIQDMRKMLLPYTALHLRENPKHTLSDYVKAFTSSMGVSHILSLSQKGPRLSLRVARSPSGPTLSFHITKFSLSGAVRHVQRRPFDSTAAFQTPAVVVANNFGGDQAPPHLRLMRIAFQNLFPAIDVTNVKLSSCRRIVLFHYETDSEGKNCVQIRHYAIRANPLGISRKVKRLVTPSNKIPNLSGLADVADYLTGFASIPDPPSDSEPDDPISHVKLPQSYPGKGNIKNHTSALKLVEIGPRLQIQLVKIERGLGSGDVIYHSFVHKTPQEVKELKEKQRTMQELKKRRREEQEANVERKQMEKEEKKLKKMKKKEDRKQEAMEQLRASVVGEEGGEGDVSDHEEASESESESESGSEEDSSQEDDSNDEEDSE